MIRALVITHGDIGRELVRVTEMILGPVSGLTAMSNAGKAATDITALIQDWLKETPTDKSPETEQPDQKLILLDDYGGSCATSAQLACGQDPGTAIISGVNLAMLLGFVTWRQSDDFEELVAKIVQKGREAIILVGGR
jgi:mannose/fructose-specific phosphotransferase system component IIA